eukprot:194688-Prymnesium_polylepis.1
MAPGEHRCPLAARVQGKAVRGPLSTCAAESAAESVRRTATMGLQFSTAEKVRRLLSFALLIARLRERLVYHGN